VTAIFPIPIMKFSNWDGYLNTIPIDQTAFPHRNSKGVGRIRPFFGPLRIDLFLLYSNKGSFLIMFFNFILEKTTLTNLVPGVPHGYHEKKYFFFHESKLDVLVDSGVLNTNIIMRAIKTLVFLKWS